MTYRLLNDDLAIRPLYETGTIPAAALTLGEWVDIRGVRTISAVVAASGDLAYDVAFDFVTSATNDGSGTAVIAGATGTFDATVDNGRVIAVDITDGAVPVDDQYIAIRMYMATAAAATTVSAVGLFGRLHSYPATNGTAEGVAAIVEVLS